MICTRYDHSQRQRKKGGRQRDGGHAFDADFGRLGKLGWRYYTLRDGKDRGGRGKSVVGRDREERRIYCEEKYGDGQTTRTNPGHENIDSAKVSTLSVVTVVEPATRRWFTPKRYAVSAEKRSITRRICANIVSVAGC